MTARDDMSAAVRARALYVKMEGFCSELLDPDAEDVIAAAITEAVAAERVACAEIALAIDSGRGNEKEIARAIEDRALRRYGRGSNIGMLRRHGRA